jgi:hypothetical protein
MKVIKEIITGTIKINIYQIPKPKTKSNQSILNSKKIKI